MKTLKIILAVFALGAGAAVSAPASAGGGFSVRFDSRPAFCHDDHDHRSHDANYYDYYPADRFSRAGNYDGKRYDDRRYDDRRYDDGRYDDRRYDDRRSGDRRYGDSYGRGDRVTQRHEFPTRYKARIVLVEKLVWNGRFDDCICTVTAYGQDAGYISQRELRSVARNYCSPRARILIDRY